MNAESKLLKDIGDLHNQRDELLSKGHGSPRDAGYLLSYFPSLGEFYFSVMNISTESNYQGTEIKITGVINSDVDLYEIKKLDDELQKKYKLLMSFAKSNDEDILIHRLSGE